MGKRKNTEDDAERIKRKLKKWQKRLKKTEENAGSTDSAEGTPPRPVPDDLEGVIEDNETAVTIPDVEEAPEELLLALGPEGGDTSETGEPILQTLASRWQNIMRDGLNKETKEQIIKKYPAPLNFAITAPALNPEIKATLSDSALKRDNRIIWRQNQMTKPAAVTADISQRALPAASLQDESAVSQTTRETTTEAAVQEEGSAEEAVFTTQPTATELEGVPPATSAAYPGCRIAVSEAFIRRGTPNSALNIMLKSLSCNTLKQYNSSLKLWWSFCYKYKVDPYQGSVPFILKFLSECFQRGSSYGSLNTTRSALSLVVGPKVGTDDRIKRFFKGLFRINPPKPKYNITWDPGQVLDYLAQKYPNESLPLEFLTKKLVTILALTSGHRVQTLSLIKVININFTTGGVQIKVPDNIKTSRKNSLQPILHLKSYINKVEICPVLTIKSYIEATKNVRKDSHNLIITYNKPHRSASTQSLSRWIKATLAEAGIDTSIFSSHSTRHAATSAASRAGINIDLIRKTAGWSSTSATFARFYDRPVSVDPAAFSEAVCDTTNRN
ncbi:uncharacterized protein LOC126376797 [Pectinophora gossypiella]|uniref:uncharacterized protein LOC126376797 n=1 Tax=Pectinophora gossypiella TaxID=13191 RepID=UPI00214F5D1C|nr:uncharacterized protein LOC126376797 [Pectinophora gossypiella]